MAAIIIAKIILKRKYNFLHFLRKVVKTNNRDGESGSTFVEEKTSYHQNIPVCARSIFVTTHTFFHMHSPEFLSSLNFVGKRKLLLKPDAVPTVNAALDKKGHASEPKKRQRGTLSKKKVRTNDTM